jgi:hypothetical protein
MGREKIYVSPSAVPDACLVLDPPYWLVQMGELTGGGLGNRYVRRRSVQAVPA